MIPSFFNLFRCFLCFCKVLDTLHKPLQYMFFLVQYHSKLFQTILSEEKI